MKQFIVLLAVLLYLVPSLGITVSAHYCGGELSGVSLGAVQEQACPCGSKRMQRNCCKDVVLSMKIKGDQQKVAPVAWKVAALPVVHPGTPFMACLIDANAEEQTSFYTVELPPGRFKEPLYLQNEAFLI